jgi:hypothetical protein
MSDHLATLRAYLQHKPECELAATGDYANGQARRISQVSGKPVPLAHWETWTYVARCTCGLDAAILALEKADFGFRQHGRQAVDQPAPPHREGNAEDIGPDPRCSRCGGTGEEPNAQFRCPCRWSHHRAGQTEWGRSMGYPRHAGVTTPWKMELLDEIDRPPQSAPLSAPSEPQERATRLRELLGTLRWERLWRHKKDAEARRYQEDSGASVEWRDLRTLIAIAETASTLDQQGPRQTWQFTRDEFDKRAHRFEGFHGVLKDDNDLTAKMLREAAKHAPSALSPPQETER